MRGSPSFSICLWYTANRRFCVFKVERKLLSFVIWQWLHYRRFLVNISVCLIKVRSSRLLLQISWAVSARLTSSRGSAAGGAPVPPTTSRPQLLTPFIAPRAFVPATGVIPFVFARSPRRVWSEVRLIAHRTEFSHQCNLARDRCRSLARFSSVERCLAVSAPCAGVRALALAADERRPRSAKGALTDEISVRDARRRRNTRAWRTATYLFRSLNAYT